MVKKIFALASVSALTGLVSAAAGCSSNEEPKANPADAASPTKQGYWFCGFPKLSTRAPIHTNRHGVDAATSAWGVADDGTVLVPPMNVAGEDWSVRIDPFTGSNSTSTELIQRLLMASASPGSA